MAYIFPTSQAARWIIAALGVDGITELGNATGVSEIYDGDLIWGEGDQAFLAAAAGQTAGYNPLPDVGEWCEIDTVYGYDDGLVICRQSHWRTIYPPEETPALFITYQPVQPGVISDWIAWEQVHVGDLRNYDGITYQCLQSHVTQPDWIPPLTPALWQAYIEPGEEWQAGVYYVAGVEVLYADDTYICLQTHTSQVGWEPPNVPALWQLVAPQSPEWQPWVWYNIGDQVTYNSVLYQCIQAHTSQPGWEPPNVPALWSVV